MNYNVTKPSGMRVETSPREHEPFQMAAYGAGSPNIRQNNQKVNTSQNKRDGYQSPQQNQRNDQVYFPITNDLRLGAQGYSSCSEMQDSEEYSRSLISKSNQGADTYAGHLSSYYDTFGGGNATPGLTHQQSSMTHQQSYNESKKSIPSKAYGMEHGNWMGMDASIQDYTLQDTTTANIAADVKTKDEISFLGSKMSAMVPARNNQQRRVSPNQNIYSKFGKQVGYEANKNTGPAKKFQNNLGRFGDQSTILDDTMAGMMDLQQNQTIHQEVQIKNLNLSKIDPEIGYFQQVNSPRKNSISPNHDAKSYGGYSTIRKGKKYILTLKIFYKTEFGESLQVVGSIEELGGWKQYKCPMKWTEGHIWVAENLEVSSSSFFNYKYVVMFQKKAVKWEKGPNRTADLDILPDINKLQILKQQKSQSPDSRISGMQSHYSGMVSSSGAQKKTVELKDHWEHFSIRFSIFSSSIKEENNEIVRIIGSIPELTKSGSVGSGPLKMRKAKKKFRWLYDKYGQEMRPWETLLKLNVNKIDGSNEIIYSYSNSGESSKDFIYEREPSRIMEIQDPSTYRGELGAQKSSQWRNWDKVWIVNGHIEKADGNFLGELFFTKVGDSGICIGTYPSKEEDVQRLAQAGITGVLNLMTVNDYRQRGFTWRKMEKAYQDYGIKSVRFPVNDLRDKDLQSNLFFAAQHLNNMLNNQNLNVYVHCTSGISRSPATVIVFLSLFKKIKCWQNHEDVAHFVKAFNHKINPNMRIIRKCIQSNEEFQKTQGETRVQQKLGETIEESFYFPNMIVEESQHNPLRTVKESTADDYSTSAYGMKSSTHSPIKRYSTTGHSLGGSTKSKAANQDHKRQLSPEKSIIPNSSQKSPVPSQRPSVVSDFYGAMPTQNTYKNQQRVHHPTNEPQLSETLADLQDEINEFNPKKFIEKVETVDLLKIEYEEPPQKKTVTPEYSADILKLQIDQEVAFKVADMQRQLKQENDLALQKALKEQQRQRESLDMQLKQKDDMLREIQSKKERDMEEMADKIRTEQEKKRVEEEHALKREYERMIAESENKKANERLDAMKREQVAAYERERIEANKVKLQQAEAERLRVEMEERLTQMMEDRLKKQMQLEQENKYAREQQELKVSKLRQEAEEAAAESKRIQKEIKKKQKAEEKVREKKAIEAEQDKLRIQQIELEALKSNLDKEYQKIEHQRRLEESQQKQNEIEAAQALQIAEQLKRELQQEKERQKLLEARRIEDLARRAEQIQQQEHEKQRALKLKRQLELKEDILKAEIAAKLKAEQLVEEQKIATLDLENKLAVERENIQLLSARKYEQSPSDQFPTEQTEYKMKSPLQSMQYLKPAKASTDQQQKESMDFENYTSFQNSSATVQAEDAPIITHTLPPHTEQSDLISNLESQAYQADLEHSRKQQELSQLIEYNEQSRQQTLSQLQIQAEQDAEQDRIKQIRKRKTMAAEKAQKEREQAEKIQEEIERTRLEEMKKDEEKKLAFLIQQKKIADERKERAYVHKQQFDEAAVKVSADFLVSYIEKTIKEIYLEQQDIEIKKSLINADKDVGSSMFDTDQAQRDRKEKLALRKEAQRLKKRNQTANLQVINKPIESPSISQLQLKSPQISSSMHEKSSEPNLEDLQRQKILQTEQELQHLQSLRKVEEEKLRLIKISREVEEQKKMIEDRNQYSSSDMNRYYQSNEISEMDQSKKQMHEQSLTDQESIILDYNAEGPMHETINRATPSRTMGVVNMSSSNNDISSQSRPNDARKLQGKETPLYSQEIEDLDQLKFEQKCDEFFIEAPIKFKPKKSNRLEEFIFKIIKRNEITIPIMHVRAQMYLIGSIRCNCELKLPDTVLVKNVPKVNGAIKLERYLLESQMEHKKALCNYMTQSHYSLDKVCDKLVKGMKIPNNSENNQSAAKSKLYATQSFSGISKKPQDLLLPTSKSQHKINLVTSQTPKNESKYSTVKTTKLSLYQSGTSQKQSYKDMSRNNMMGKRQSLQPLENKALNVVKSSLYQSNQNSMQGRRYSETKIIGQQASEQYGRGQGAPFVTPLKNISLDISQSSARKEAYQGNAPRSVSPGSSTKLNQRFTSSRQSNTSQNKTVVNTKQQMNQKGQSPTRKNLPVVKTKLYQDPEKPSQAPYLPSASASKPIEIYSKPQAPQFQPPQSHPDPIKISDQEEDIVQLQQSYLDAQINEQSFKNKYFQSLEGNQELQLDFENSDSFQNHNNEQEFIEKARKEITVAIETPSQPNEQPKNLWTSASAEKIVQEKPQKPLGTGNFYPSSHLMDTYSMNTVPEMSENQENQSFISAQQNFMIKNSSIASFKKEQSDAEGMTFTDAEEETKNLYFDKINQRF